MSLVLNCALCAVILCVGVYSKEELILPEPLKVCKQASDDYSSCMRLALQESWPAISNGIPEYDSPNLDPFVITAQDTIFGSGDVRGRVQLKNTRTYGFSKAKFLSVKPAIEGDNFRMEIDVEIPKVFVEGEYKAQGSLGAFKMAGKGLFNISMEGVRTTWDIEGVVKNDRLIVTHFRSEPEVDKMKVWFSDLFNGNEELNRAAMDFVNEYWPILYKGMIPFVAQAQDVTVTETLNRVFSKIPYSKLFP